MNRETRNLINMGALKCCICGLAIERPADYSVEHEPPKSRQEECGLSKTYPAHKWCNNDKGSLTLDEYRVFCELRAKRAGQHR